MKLILLALLPLLTISTQIDCYSQVWSGKKYPQRTEKQLYFFAIPQTFKSSVNYESGQIQVTFPSKTSDRGNLKLVNDGVKNLTSSQFADFYDVLFDDIGVQQITVNLQHDQFNITLLRNYRNKDFISVQVKFQNIVNTKDEIQPASYITFDFFLKNVTEKQIADFQAYIAKYIKPAVKSNLYQMIVQKFGQFRILAL